MTHLKIQLNNIPETVTTALLDKLYGIVSANDYVYHSDDLQGTLLVDKAYEDTIAYLQQKYPDLHITATTLYIRFADPEVQRVMTNWWGDGIGCTVADMLSHSSLNFTTDDSTYGHYPFYGNTGIRTFNELGRFTNITSIGAQTFRECTNLTSIDLSNITYLASGVFQGCSSLTSINLPSYVLGSTSGATMYFSDCSNVTSITFGPNYEGIKDNDAQMFAGCSSLTTIAGMPAPTRTFIPYGWVRGCTNLTTIGNWQTLDTITAYREGCFNGCNKLPLTIDFTPVTYVNGKAFYQCYKMNFIGTLDADLTNSQEAFVDCDLSNCTMTLNTTVGIKKITFKNAKLPSVLTIGNNCTYIEYDAFYNTTGLTTVTGGSNLATIGSNCFYNCSDLTTVNISNSNVSVGNLAFKNCSKLESTNPISITVSTTTQGSDTYEVFYGCSELTSVILTGLDLSIGDSFFRDCTKLSSVQGLDKIKYLSGHAFFNNPLLTGELNFSNLVGRCTRNAGSVRPTSYGFFYNVGATKIHIPSWDESFLDFWATYTGRAFFISCPNLKEVLIHIPDNGFPNYRNGNIRSVLFENCPSMERLIINNTSVAPLKNTSDIVDLIDIGGSNVTLYVPDNLVNDYKTATGWSNIASNIKGMSELPSS